MSKIKKFIIFLGDLIVLYGALALTLVIRYGFDDFVIRWDAHLFPFSVIFILWILTFYIFNLYRYKVSKTENILNKVFVPVLTAGIISLMLFYFLPNFFGLTPKINILIFGVLVLGLKYLWQNFLLFNVFTRGAEKVIVIGNSKLINETVDYVKDNPHLGYSIEAWIETGKNLSLDNILKVMKITEAKLIVIPSHLDKDMPMSKLAYKLLSYDVNIINFWDFYEVIFEKVPLDELEESWFIENISAYRPFYDSTKRIFDILFSSILLVIFSPFIFLFSFLIKLTSSGPVIYKQNRLGKNERLFTLYKFRTMKNGENGPLWTEENDSRITPIGKFLRFTHLDELPQLINILKGDISVIGPRPERVELTEKYSKIPYYETRHIIKPGLTGWAQINFKPSTSIEEAKDKLCYDVYYIKNRSFTLDLIIALKTGRYILTK